MSRLQEISKEYREREIKRNGYDLNDEYNVSHENALSDGDEKGKGEKNGSIGGATDIERRQRAAATNKYNRERPYDDSTA